MGNDVRCNATSAYTAQDHDHAHHDDDDVKKDDTTSSIEKMSNSSTKKDATITILTITGGSG